MYLQSSLTRFSIEHPILPTRKTVINSSRANLSLDLWSFLLQNQSLVFFLQLPLFICPFYRCILPSGGDLLNLPKFYRASSVPWHALTGKWKWLTNQSEHAIYFCYVIKRDKQNNSFAKDRNVSHALNISVVV